MKVKGKPKKQFSSFFNGGSRDEAQVDRLGAVFPPSETTRWPQPPFWGRTSDTFHCCSFWHGWPHVGSWEDQKNIEVIDCASKPGPFCFILPVKVCSGPCPRLLWDIHTRCPTVPALSSSLPRSTTTQRVVTVT